MPYAAAPIFLPCLRIFDFTVQARKLGVNPSDSARSTLWQGEILRSFHYRAPRRRDLHRFARKDGIFVILRLAEESHYYSLMRSFVALRMTKRLRITTSQSSLPGFRGGTPDLLSRHRVLVFLSFGSVFFLFASKKKENEQSKN